MKKLSLISKRGATLTFLISTPILWRAIEKVNLPNKLWRLEKKSAKFLAGMVARQSSPFSSFYF